ncbi:MAG TPA: serine hydrolase [Pyrinomonadaceae bacterium]|nr:serine hydrolase [Pyrinomonadaceae bacterium]
MKKILAAAFLTISFSVCFGQPANPQGPLERRAADVCALFSQNPGGYDKLFTPAFLEKVPAAQFTAIFTQYFSQLGPCTTTKITKRQTDFAADFEFSFEKGYTVPATISVVAEAPNLIDGLWLGNATKSSGSLADIVSELKSLPGETSMLVVRLDSQGVAPLVAYNADRELAIGSAFKLYILAELAREVDANQRKLSDVVTLNDHAVSLPSGVLQTWPSGSPLTLHTLATFMISISDNTAADQLLNILGRERVEAMLVETKHAQPDLDKPFLSTLEMFKLKGEPTHKAADQYLALDVNGRRRFLTEQIAAVKREDAKPYADGKPAYIDRIEWFASANDLARVMNWLRAKTEPGMAPAPLREIMAINPGSGLNVSRERWNYIGYKGGSEPGVLNMTYLLESKKGQWYAMVISWNNRDAALDNAKVFALVQRALQIID